MVKKFGQRYHTLSNIEAIPKDVEKEFHDQFMKPYEKKKEENGEILPLAFTPLEIEKCLNAESAKRK